jgi:hypothetical protein
MSTAYRYKYTGKGKPPFFRTPMLKIGDNEYEFPQPINHPDFQPVGKEAPADPGPSKDTEKKTGKSGKKSNKDREE